MITPQRLSSKTTGRIRLSVVVHRAHRLLFGLVLSIFVGIGFAYLFWINHLGMQGIRLSELSQEKISLMDEKGQIEAKMAAYGSTAYLNEHDMVTALPIKDRATYMVIKDVLTAQSRVKEEGI